MMTVKKSSLALVTSFLAGGLLAGCGGTQTPSAESAGSDRAPGVILALRRGEAGIRR